MSQFDNHDTDDESSGISKWNFINRLVPVLTLVTIVICAALLALVVNLGSKVDGLEVRLQAMQDMSAVSGSAPVNMSETDVSEVDESEVVDLAEAAVLESGLVWDGSRDQGAGIRRVYLTFDDGPSSNTDRILDILGQYGVKATFFVVAKENYTEQYRRIVEEGHTLGMHSYSHKYNEIYASLDAYRQDLTKLHDFLYELTGEDCSIVRFPGGSSNAVSRVDMRDLAAYLEEEDMVYFDWNISSGDAVKDSISAGQITQNVLDNLDINDTIVILFHDAADKGTTVSALPGIIEKILESEDTVMLPISEDTVRVQHLQGS